MPRPITIDDLLTMRRIGGYREGLLVSPDARLAAFRVSEITPDESGYVYAWRSLPLDGSAAPTRFADAGEPVQRPGPSGTINGHPEDSIGRWSPDGRQFAFLAQHDGVIQLWVATPGDGRSSLLVAADDDVQDVAWSPDGKTLLLTFDPTRRRIREARADGDLHGFRLDEDVAPVYALAPTRPHQPDATVWVVQASGGALRHASDAEAQVFADRKSAGSVPDREFTKLAVRSASTGAFAWAEVLPDYREGNEPPMRIAAGSGSAAASVNYCDAPECIGQIERIWWAGDGEVLFVRREGHALATRGFYAWQVGAKSVRRLYSTNDWIADCNLVRDWTLACFDEAPTQPRRVVRLDLKSGDLAMLYDSNPQFAAIAFTRVERVDVTDSTGHESFAHVVYPADFKPGTRYPAVIVQYRSRGFLVGGTGDEYPVHVLAQHGYMVLSIERPEHAELDARLPVDQVQLITERDYIEQRIKQDALELILDKLDAEGLIDPKRVGITGLSDGSETVFWGLQYSSRFACAAVSTPPTDPTAYELTSTAARARFRDIGLRPPDQDGKPFGREWWERSSAIFHLDRFTMPLLMNLGESEAMMGAPLHARLTDLGRPVETYIYPGEHHIKARPSIRRAVYTRNLDWFDFWLRGVEDTGPAKAEQYERWRKLREARDAG